MLRLTAVAAVIVLLNVGLAAAGDPPRPNIEKPVDYIKWYNEEFSEGIRENAAETYLEAVADFDIDQETSALLGSGAGGTWTEEQVEPLRQLVSRHEGALDKLTAAAGMARCHFTIESESGVAFEVRLMYLAPLRSLAKLAATRARLRLAEGNIDGAVADVSAILRLGEHLRQQPMLISYLVGNACCKLAYDVLYDLPVIAAGPVDYDGQVLSKLKKVDRTPRPPTRQIMAEKACAFDFAQRFLRDTDGDGLLDRMAAPDIPGLSDQSGPITPPRSFEDIVRDLDGMYTRIGKLYDVEYTVARQQADTLDRDVAAQKGTVISVLVPSLTGVLKQYLHLTADRNACRVMLHLHAWRAAHGCWPHTLAEALPKNIARRHIDPASGKSFGYRLQDGEPLLYSVGHDCVDDGGERVPKTGKPRWEDTGDYVFWPRPKPSTTTQPAEKPGD